VPTMYTALGGLEIVLEAGMPRVRERNAALTARLVEQLSERGFPLRIADVPERRSAIVLVREPESSRVVAALAERNIIVDSRGPYVRVSPHFYNTADEIDAFVTALQQVATAR
jgi:kynureninase